MEPIEITNTITTNESMNYIDICEIVKKSDFFTINDPITNETQISFPKISKEIWKR